MSFLQSGVLMSSSKSTLDFLSSALLGAGRLCFLESPHSCRQNKVGSVRKRHFYWNPANTAVWGPRSWGAVWMVVTELYGIVIVFTKLYGIRLVVKTEGYWDGSY